MNERPLDRCGLNSSVLLGSSPRWLHQYSLKCERGVPEATAVFQHSSNGNLGRVTEGAGIKRLAQKLSVPHDFNFKEEDCRPLGGVISEPPCMEKDSYGPHFCCHSCCKDSSGNSP